MNHQQKLTSKQYFVPFVLITSLFFLWGFARAILDVLNKHFQNTLDISITQSAFIQVTTYLGYFLMAIPAGIYIDKKGYKHGVVFGLLLFGLGALLFIPSKAIGHFNGYLFSLFVIGCGLVFLETAANPYVTELGPNETSTSRLNFSQSFNGLGSLFATFAIGQFLFDGSETGGNVVVPYTALGVMVFIIAVVFSRSNLPEIQNTNDIETHSATSNYRKLMKHPTFVFGLIALLAYEVAEISINSYFINFVTAQGWLTDNMASIVLTAALAFFMVGRFVGSWLMQRIKPKNMLLYCACGTVGCITLVLLDLGKISMVALIATYLFEAIMFPTIFALSVRGLGNLTKSAASLLMMTPIGGCGFLLMGYIADTTNMVVPFMIPWIGYAIVMLFAWYLVKNR